MEKTGKNTGTGMDIGLTTPNPPCTCTRFLAVSYTHLTLPTNREV